MSRSIYILLFLLAGCLTSLAQQDSVSLLGKLHSKINGVDSIKLPTRHSAKADSAKKKLSKRKREIKQKRDKVNAMLDSLSPDKKLEQVSRSIDSTKAAFSSKLDSLIHLPFPDTLVTGKMAALQSAMDSLKTIGPLEDVNKARKKLATAQANVNKKVKGVEGKISGKLSGFNENGGNAGKLNLPGASGQSGLKGLNRNTSLPGADLQLPKGTLGNLEIKQVKLNSEMPTLSGAKVGDMKLGKNIPGSDGLANLGGSFGKAEELSKQAKGYQSDLKNVTSGNLDKMEQLPKTMESKLTGIEEVQALQKQTGDYAAMTKQLNSDPEVMKEMALNKAKEQAVNHFAGHEKELQAAMEQLSKVKAKYKDAETVLDLFKKPANPMKGKPFVERLIPGIGFQIQSSSNQWFDFNPYLGYRWTGKLNAGIGWMERVSSNFKRRHFVSKEHAFGARAYAEFKWKDNIHLRAEAEYVNAPITSPYLVKAGEPDGRAWVWSYFVGAKKSFAFSKTVKGNVQAMYNLYNPEKRSPYLNRFNVRMGFEFPMNKKKKNGKSVK